MPSFSIRRSLSRAVGAALIVALASCGGQGNTFDALATKRGGDNAPVAPATSTGGGGSADQCASDQSPAGQHCASCTTDQHRRGRHCASCAPTNTGGAGTAPVAPPTNTGGAGTAPAAPPTDTGGAGTAPAAPPTGHRRGSTAPVARTEQHWRGKHCATGASHLHHRWHRRGLEHRFRPCIAKQWGRGIDHFYQRQLCLYHAACQRRQRPATPSPSRATRTQPQTCTVNNGNGDVTNAIVDTVKVSCIDGGTIVVTVSGLPNAITVPVTLALYSKEFGTSITRPALHGRCERHI